MLDPIRDGFLLKVKASCGYPKTTPRTFAIGLEKMEKKSTFSMVHGGHSMRDEELLHITIRQEYAQSYIERGHGHLTHFPLPILTPPQIGAIAKAHCCHGQLLSIAYALVTQGPQALY